MSIFGLQKTFFFCLFLLTSEGLGTEAIKTLLKYIFSTTEDENFTIVADIDPNNFGSIKLLEKLGFNQTGRQENTICINGTWFDSLFYNLKKKDFKI